MIVGYLIGAALSVPALLLWITPHQWWMAVERFDAMVAGGYRLKPLLQSVPAATLAGWISFAIVIPIGSVLSRDVPGPPSEQWPFFAAALSPFLLWISVVIADWPLWLVPPAARRPAEAKELHRYWPVLAAVVAGGLALSLFGRATWELTAALLGAAVVLLLFQVVRTRF